MLGIEDLSGPPGSDGPQPPPPDGNPNLTPCKAQRLVHIVGGNGGLAWFTQIWPVPSNVTDFTPTVSLDNPQNFVARTVDPTHPVFARTTDMGVVAALWDGTGTAPQPTILLAGTNETHTNVPSTAITSGGNGLVPAAGVIQTSLAPRVPVLLIGNVPYGTAPMAPQAMTAADVEPAITSLQSAGTISMVEANQLRPSATQLATYFDANVPVSVSTLGTRLAFAANAFRMGVFGSVVVTAFNDDPHGAFADIPSATARANQLAKMLDAFYTDLASANEAGCGDDTGNFLPVADNTVMMVTGDTYKAPFNNSGWGDGTPNNTNLMYLRSNGYIKPGWFGSVTPAATSFFDPATGQLGGTQAPDTQAAWASALYAVARGNAMAIAPFTAVNFAGTKAK